MMEFLAGAVAMGFFVAGAFFVRFWLKTGDRFFLAFAIAFVLFALNQLLVTWLGANYEHIAYAYLLRVVGYMLILGAIVDKNLSRKSGAEK